MQCDPLPAVQPYGVFGACCSGVSRVCKKNVLVSKALLVVVFVHFSSSLYPSKFSRSGTFRVEAEVDFV